MPIAFIAYYPSIVILRPDEIPLLSWLSPLIGVLFFYGSYKFWMFGALKYSGTGSWLFYKQKSRTSLYPRNTGYFLFWYTYSLAVSLYSTLASTGYGIIPTRYKFFHTPHMWWLYVPVSTQLNIIYTWYTDFLRKFVSQTVSQWHQCILSGICCREFMQNNFWDKK